MSNQFIYPRAAVKRFPATLHLNDKSRGVYTGMFEKALKKTAEQISIEIDAREARLALASEVFGRGIASFKGLSDAEIWALHQWITVGKQDAYRVFKPWLAKREAGHG